LPLPFLASLIPLLGPALSLTLLARLLARIHASWPDWVLSHALAKEGRAALRRGDWAAATTARRELVLLRRGSAKR
jgi:hypothetical protein